MRRLAVIAVIVALGGAAFAAIDPARPRALEPLARLAGAGPGADAAARRAAADRLEAAVATLGTIVEGGIDPDDETREFFSKLLRDLGRLDLASLHDRLPEEDRTLERTWHRVGFSGRALDGRYAVRRVAWDEVLAFSPEEGSLGSRLLDVSLGLRTREGDDEASYVANLRAGVGVGFASWERIVAALVEAIRVVEECPVEAPRLEALVAQAFPALADHAGPLVEVSDVFIRDQCTAGWKHVHLA